MISLMHKYLFHIPYLACDNYSDKWLFAQWTCDKLISLLGKPILAILKGGGHANFDADFFVPMDSLGDAQVKNNTFKLLKFH